jgi:hypothetical protein
MRRTNATCNPQFEHQYQLKSRIDQCHRDAIRAEQLHVAGAGQSKRMIGVATKLNFSVRTMLNAAYACFRLQAAVGLESDVEALDPGVTV